MGGQPPPYPPGGLPPPYPIGVGWRHAGLRCLPARLVRRPGRPRRGHAVPGERHPWPRRSAGAAGRRGRALLRGRRRQPDQPAVPGPAGRDPRGLPGQRAFAPRLLGEQELDALPGRYGAGHGRRRRAACRRPGDLRLQLLLGLPAVPRGHRAGARHGRAGRAQDRQDQAFLQPPGLHRAVHREHARGAGHAPRRPAGRRPPGVHGAQHPGRDGRGQRAGGNRALCRRADRGRRPGCRTDRRWHAPVDAGLPEPERSALPAVARTRHPRPPG